MNAGEKAELLSAECERLARQAERRMTNLDLTPQQRAQAADEAKAYWQLARDHEQTAKHGAQAKVEEMRPLAEKGQRHLAATSQGGQITAQRRKARQNALRQKMQELIEAGHSVSNAARLAAKSGLGTSQEANRKMWSRQNN